MSFLNRQAAAIKNSWQPESIGELDRHISSGGGMFTHTGLFVSEQSSLNHIEVLKCARVRAEVRGCLETKVYRWTNTARTRKEEARDHPLFYLLNVAENDETDAQSYIERQELFLSLWGNDGSIITRNTSRNKNITSIDQLSWWDVRVDRDRETGKLAYKYRDRGKWEPIPTEKMFHINTMALDGVNGLSFIGMARESVSQGIALTTFANKFFSNGMHTNMVLETAGVLTETGRDNMRTAMAELKTGLEHSWEPFILEEGAKWSTIPMNFVDAQFIDILKLNKLDIDGLFRVPPPMVGNSYQGLTYNNIEQLSLDFVLFSLLPCVTRFETMANWKLLSRQEFDAGYFVKTNLDTLLRADSKTRGEYFKNKVQNGAASPNDWRIADGENPIDHPSGDEHYANGNFRTLPQICANDIKTNNQTGGDGNNATE